MSLLERVSGLLPGMMHPEEGLLSTRSKCPQVLKLLVSRKEFYLSHPLNPKGQLDEQVCKH